MSNLKLGVIGILLLMVVAIDFRMFMMSLLADAVIVAGIVAVYMFWPDKE